jgi:hypothetical protein
VYSQKNFDTEQDFLNAVADGFAYLEFDIKVRQYVSGADYVVFHRERLLLAIVAVARRHHRKYLLKNHVVVVILHCDDAGKAAGESLLLIDGLRDDNAALTVIVRDREPAHHTLDLGLRISNLAWQSVQYGAVSDKEAAESFSKGFTPAAYGTEHLFLRDLTLGAVPDLSHFPNMAEGEKAYRSKLEEEAATLALQ